MQFSPTLAGQIKEGAATRQGEPGNILEPDIVVMGILFVLA
ncbi:MAG: hypothetical protein ACOC39_02025 [Desulfovermiculus sp.]